MNRRHVPIAEPFDLEATLRTTGTGRWDEHDQWWWSRWGSNGASTLRVVRVADGVEARAWGPDAQTLLDQFPMLIGVDDRSRLRFPGTPADPFLKRMAGMRLGATGDLHGALVKAILGQIVTTAESAASFRSLCARFGDPAAGPVTGTFTVPSPSTIASLTYEDLHGAGIERRRAVVLIEAARRWSRLAPIVDASPSEARAALESIRGVGPWTSAKVVGAALGAPDEVPVGDYHLPNHVAWALAGEDRADDDRMLELLEPYRPVRRRVTMAIVQSGVAAPRYGQRAAIRRHL